MQQLRSVDADRGRSEERLVLLLFVRREGNPMRRRVKTVRSAAAVWGLRLIAFAMRTNVPIWRKLESMTLVKGKRRGDICIELKYEEGNEA